MLWACCVPDGGVLRSIASHETANPAPTWLGAEASAGLSLTGSYAAVPTAAVSGLYFSHPEAR